MGRWERRKDEDDEEEEDEEDEEVRREGEVVLTKVRRSRLD
jgi:hypothetical protein